MGSITKCHHINIQGLNSKVKATGYGTISFTVLDDSGQLHKMIVNNVLYVPEAPINLLSPQRWSQTSDDKRGTLEATFGYETIMVWGDQQYMKTIQHHPDLNIPLLTVNEGFDKASVFFAGMDFCQECTTQDHSTPAFLTTSKPINPDKNKQDYTVIPNLEGDLRSVHAFPASSTTTSPPTPQPSEIDLNDDNNSVGSDLSTESAESIAESTSFIPQNQLEEIMSSFRTRMSKNQRELMDIHIKLKHLPFSAIKRLAMREAIPKEYATVEPPICP